MLKPEEYSRLESAETAEQLALLAGLGYEGIGINAMLKNERKRLWELCLELLGDSPESKALMLVNDFHNIKAVLKSAFAKTDFESLIYMPTNINCEKLYEEAKAGKFSVGTEICSNAYEIYKKSGIRAFELYLERRELESIAECTTGFMHSYSEILKLCANLKIYLRYSGELLEEALISCKRLDKDFLVRNEGERAAALAKEGYKEAFEAYKKSPEALDEYCENLKNEFLKAAEYEFFGFSPVLLYLVKKLRELEKIRKTVMRSSNV